MQQLGGSDSKESACQCRKPMFDSWVEKIPWRKKCQPTLVFLPGKSHGQRSLVGYSPQDHKESDMTEQLSTYRRRKNFSFVFTVWLTSAQEAQVQSALAFDMPSSLSLIISSFWLKVRDVQPFLSLEHLQATVGYQCLQSAIK